MNRDPLYAGLCLDPSCGWIGPGRMKFHDAVEDTGEHMVRTGHYVTVENLALNRARAEWRAFKRSLAEFVETLVVAARRKVRHWFDVLAYLAWRAKRRLAREVQRD